MSDPLSLPANSRNFAAESYWRLSMQTMVSALVLHVVFASVFFALRVEQLIWLNLVCVTMYVGCIVLTKRGLRNLVTGLVWVEIIGHALLSARLLGWESGFQYYMWLLVPLIFFNTERSVATKWSLAGVVVLCNVAAAIWLQGRPPIIPLPAIASDILGKFNIGCYLAISGFLSMVYARAAGEAERQLHALATTDALTGLANRRRLLDMAAVEIARARRTPQPMCVILLDIDNFKSINDRFGHAGGDHVLIEVTKMIRRVVRAQDYVARWGGEEFLILMPGVALDTARATAERIRLTLASATIAVHQLDADPLRITATMGVSERQPAEDIEQCIARADAAMYHGKTNGRDQVEINLPGGEDEFVQQALAV